MDQHGFAARAARHWNTAIMKCLRYTALSFSGSVLMGIISSCSKSPKSMPVQNEPLSYAQTQATKLELSASKEAELLAKANQGDAESSFWLSECYEVREWYLESYKWKVIAAEQGDAAAAYKVGLCYTQDVSYNLTRAKYWMEIAQKRGHQQASEELKRLEPLIKEEEAKKAEFNTPVQDGRLSYAQAQAAGLELSASKEAELLTKANQGDAESSFWLSECYGVREWYLESYKWQVIAAEQGDASAAANVGFYYTLGKFHNLTRAKYWMEFAQKRGHQRAAEGLGRIEELFKEEAAKKAELNTRSVDSVPSSKK